MTGVHVLTVDGAGRAEPYPFAGTRFDGLAVNFVLAGTRPVRRVRVAQQQRVRVDATGSTPDQRNRSLLIHRARRQRRFFLVRARVRNQTPGAAAPNWHAPATHTAPGSGMKRQVDISPLLLICDWRSAL